MAARTFQDEGGTHWEVFEVRRAIEAPRGVSAGLEHGWLTFVSDEGKRRLAPFPAGWEQLPPEALMLLCGQARAANAPRVVAASVQEEARDGAAPSPGDDLRAMVRGFVGRAREERLPAIETIVRLKGAIAERFGADALDQRTLRRWFVEAYYFERDDKDTS